MFRGTLFEKHRCRRMRHLNTIRIDNKDLKLTAVILYTYILSYLGLRVSHKTDFLSNRHIAVTALTRPLVTCRTGVTGLRFQAAPPFAECR